MSGQTLRIGTRKSAMALAQTEAIARLLRASDPALDVEIVKLETRGDQDQTSKLLRHGGKGGAFRPPKFAKPCAQADCRRRCIR